MKKRSIVSLFIMCSSLYAGYVKNRLNEIKLAKEHCLADKAKCSVPFWNKLSEIMEKKLKIPYSFDIKPENVTILYNDRIYTFTPGNVNRAIALDPNRNMPIHYVAAKGDVGDLKTLLAWGADINSKNKYDETPLIKATQTGNFYAVPFLLENQALISQSRRPFEDFNPFHYAVLLPKRINESSSNVVKILHALINSDPDRLYLNKSSRKGTPLEIAVVEKLDPLIINFLILHGAEITRKSKKDATKLGDAYEHVKKKILEE